MELRDEAAQQMPDQAAFRPELALADRADRATYLGRRMRQASSRAVFDRDARIFVAARRVERQDSRARADREQSRNTKSS
jgi:hypothetical protein